jgi:hypothetical protein
LPDLEKKGFQFEKVQPPNPNSSGRLKKWTLYNTNTDLKY